MSEYLWITSIKARVLENCELDSDGSEFQYVECLLLAQDNQQIIDEIKKALPALRLELVEIIKSGIYQPEEWQHHDDPLFAELIQDAANQAKADHQLTFGPFTSSNYLS